MELIRKLWQSLAWVTLPDEDAPRSRTFFVSKLVADYFWIIWEGLCKAMLYVYTKILFIPESFAMPTTSISRSMLYKRR